MWSFQSKVQESQCLKINARRLPLFPLTLQKDHFCGRAREKVGVGVLMPLEPAHIAFASFRKCHEPGKWLTNGPTDADPT